MHTRHAVCVLADMQPEHFKSLARRDQLPTIHVPVVSDEKIEDDAGTRGWNRFSDVEAVQIAVSNALAVQMGYADGVSHATASKIVNCNGGAIVDALAKIGPLASGGDVWMSYVAYGDAGGANRSGDLASITLGILSEMANGGSVARIFAINISDVVRKMILRATAAGIAFPHPSDS